MTKNKTGQFYQIILKKTRIKNLNVRPESTKLEENIGSLSNTFLDLSPRGKQKQK